MARVLDRLGRSAARHHWWFIGAWLVAAVLCVVIAVTLDGQTNDTFTTPGAQSQTGARPARGAVSEPGRRHRHRRVRRAAGCRRSAGAAGDPGEHREPREAAARLERREPDHRHERTVRRQDRARHRAVRHAGARRRPRRVQVVASRPPQPAADAGVKLAFGGAVVDYANQAPSGDADLIGLLAAVIILLFAFGSVVAMGLPILTALFGLGVGVALINIVAAFTDHRHARAHRSPR